MRMPSQVPSPSLAGIGRVAAGGPPILRSGITPSQPNGILPGPACAACCNYCDQNAADNFQLLACYGLCQNAIPGCNCMPHG